jgi:hypothetical protein
MICDFEKLCMFLDRKLTLNQQLEVLDHLDTCDICRKTARQLKQERDAGVLVGSNVAVDQAKKAAGKGLSGNDARCRLDGTTPRFRRKSLG